ncbi:hypothetical protein BGZ90_006609 [Linnemannia elongata]|nr:hypothetical protein BGZ90_006609 [Linnemannia elongata]
MVESARSTPCRESSLIQKTTTTRAAADVPSENKVVVISRQQPATSDTASHPLSAIDSIFKLGQGLSSMFTSGKNKVTASMNTGPGNNNRLRTGKNRAPTPYPGSLVDPTEDSAASDYAVSMKDDSYPPKTVLKLSPPSPPLHPHNQGGCGGNGYTIEDIVNNTSISLAALPSISQFPTLDGYPLIKSSSTMDFGAEVSGGDAAAAGGDRRPSNATTIRPLMLPLSRTPTIQTTSQVYTHTSSLDDDHNGILKGQLAEADEFYENEYHHDYPVISISNSRLNSLIPTSGVANADVSGNGLFRLPNRDIGVSSTLALALTPDGGNNSGSSMIQSSSLLTHSTGPAATPTTVMAPASPNHQQQFTSHNHNEIKPHYQSSYTERHDPMERLLLLKAQQQQSNPITPNDPTASFTHQHLESATNTALQFLQRTRTVANWAQEQSRIQEKRARHYARTRALRELRKQDPTATLSVRSSSGSSFSDFSELSSFSTSTSSSASGSASGSGASTSKFVPQSPQQYRHQQPSIQARSTPPPSSSSLTREKLVINTNFGGGKMPSFSRHFANSNGSGGGLVIDSVMMEDIQLDHPARLEMLIQEEDEDEEEEPGLYIDTDDVLSPSMEIESLGAGVGRL